MQANDTLAERIATPVELTRRTPEEERMYYLQKCFELQNIIRTHAARIAELEDGLREIAEMQARPFEGIPADWSDQVAACPECQQYKGHPIQHGICDSHREPLWAREKHNNHELGVGMRCRMVGIARDLLAPRGSDAACPNCGCTETLPPIPGTFGIPCAKCCG